MQWSLEDIYKKQVRGNIPPRRHLRVLGEKFNLEDAPGLERVRKELSGETPIRANLSFIGKQINSKEDIEKLNLDPEMEEYLKKTLSYCLTLPEEDREACWQELAGKVKTHPIDNILTRYLVSRDWPSVSAGKYAGELVKLLTKDVDDMRGFSTKDLEDYIEGNIAKPNFGTETKGNLVTDLGKIKVPSDFVYKLMQHKTQDEKIRGVGMGELAMTIFFDNVKAATGKGDLSIDDQELEIKGHGAALGATGDQRLDIRELVKKPLEAGGLGIGYKDVLAKTGKLRFTGPTYGGKIYNAANFAQAIADAYADARDKKRFKDNFWTIIEKNFNSGQKGEMGNEQDVKRVYDEIDLTSADDINSTIALMNFVRYISKEEVNHFMVHDFGSRGKIRKTTGDYGPSTPANRGDYIYVHGEPLEMAQQLSELGEKVGFERIQLNNLRPRIGLPMHGGGFYGAPTVLKDKY